MSTKTTPIAPRAWSLNLAAAWILTAVGELLLAQGGANPPSWGTIAAELGLATVIGAVHARFSPPDWKGGLGWPGSLLVLSAVLRGEVLASWAWWPMLVLGPVVCAVAVRVLHDLTRRLPAPLTVIVLSLVAITLDRTVTLMSARVAQVPMRLGEDLVRPLARLMPQATKAEGPPIVVLTIDTLRADHAVRMKSWDWMAQRGRTWPQAMSTASWTVPSVASIWTGELPEGHQAGKIPDGGFSPISTKVPTFAEQATAKGYRTAAFVVNPFVSSSLGFRRGFSTWLNPDEQVSQPLGFLGNHWTTNARDAEVVIDHALHWLEDAPSGGWLLWVHLFDPHLPYTQVPEGHEARRVKHPKLLRTGKVKTTPKLKAAVREAYQAEVDYADTHALRLLEALDQRGFFQTGTLVFTVDHGEEFWEHSDFEHGHSHHREVTEIPMALLSPGLSAGEGRGVASLVDVTPTLQAVLGQQSTSKEGNDLRTDLAQDRIAKAAGNLYGSPQTSCRNPILKVIETRPIGEDRAAEAFDLQEDPDELAPKAPENGEPVYESCRILKDAVDADNAEADTSCEKLRELGYVDDCP